MRGAWVGVAKSAPAPEAPPPKAAAREEFLFADDDLLTQHGFDVARRTVAKYRSELNILPSHLRKVY